MALPIPEFIERDVNQIVAEMIAFYETATGRTLQPSQSERLLINAFAYREAILRSAINDAAMQNLVAFARYPMIDYLGQLVGVERLPAAPAECTIEFTFVSGHSGFVLPEGTRVASADGKAVFAVKEDTDIDAGELSRELICAAVTAGTSGNGFLAGAVNVILDPVTGVDSAMNTDTSTGGSDEETDDALRERVKLAPEAFSNAGSRGAYTFHALSAHPTIIDVSVTSPTPGIVNIYPLSTAGVPTPNEVLEAVDAACNDEKVRPLTDTVNIIAPDPVDYTLEVELTLYTDANQTLIEQTVQEALQAFADDKGKQLGRDIIRNQVIGLCTVDGVYNVDLTSLTGDIILDETQFGNCTNIVVTTIGLNNG